MDLFSVTNDEISDGDAQSSDNSIFNKNVKQETSTSRSSRRKQSAPRSRLIRQCGQCEFSSSNNHEFQMHLKNDHQHEEIFLCDQCRSYFFDSIDHQNHCQTHQSVEKNLSSSSPLKLTICTSEREGNESDGEEQNQSPHTETKFHLTPVPSSQSIAQVDRKRPYNVSVDPARYRRVADPDDPNAVKYACSLCGNLYKWRKSLNKHWKEKHNDEAAPPLDAPVTIRPSKPRTTEMIPQQPSIVVNPPPPSHHPAFTLNPYSWFNFPSHPELTSLFSTSNNDSSSNVPLDLTMKSNKKSLPSIDCEPPVPRKKFHRDSHSSNEEQRDSSNYNMNESDEDNQSEHASSSSPANGHGPKLFICSICEQRFVSIEMINEHFIEQHLNELENQISGKCPPRNTNVAQQNEQWNLSDPVNPLKCIQCDFVGRWPTELQKHAASHSTSRPFKCLICSLTYKWRWDLAKHWDRAHLGAGKGNVLINPYKKRDRDQARSMIDIKPSTTNDRHSTCSSESIQKNDDEQSETSNLSDDEKDPSPLTHPFSTAAAAAAANLFFASNPFLSQFLLPSRSSSPVQSPSTKKFDKEERNFQCRWCDYRGRWRSELIQHMRCHHARDKPYHCSACTYASSWKWDVQKHVKKQHPNDSAKIVELPDKYLFQTKLKAKYESIDDRSLAPDLLTEEDFRSFSVDVQEKLATIKPTRDRTLVCQQCPFAANSMAELRRHLIVHSSENPYHCFNCDFKSKWKCDVKKHMRSANHQGPVLVGRKAMAKVMETLGLVLGNGKTSTDVDELEAEEEEIEDDNHRTSSNANLRCRQCDYEADDLSDFLHHRKTHQSIKSNADQSQSNMEQDEQIFNYEFLWLENNPLIKSFTTIHRKNRSIDYRCSHCDYSIVNNHEEFINHLDDQHGQLFPSKSSH